MWLAGGDLYSRDGVAFLAIGDFGCLRFVHLVVKRSQLVLGEVVDNAGTQAVSHHVCHGAEAIPTGEKKQVDETLVAMGNVCLLYDFSVAYRKGFLV